VRRSENWVGLDAWFEGRLSTVIRFRLRNLDERS